MQRLEERRKVLAICYDYVFHRSLACVIQDNLGWIRLEKNPRGMELADHSVDE